MPVLKTGKVLDQLRERIPYLHYSLRTEDAYVYWTRAFIRFHGVRHPATISQKGQHQLRINRCCPFFPRAMCAVPLWPCVRRVLVQHTPPSVF
jgi:hypothetical protein